MTGLVTATGMDTYFGKTAHLVEQATTVSRFQRALPRIGNFLILVTVGLVLIIGTVMVVAHKDRRVQSRYARVINGSIDRPATRNLGPSRREFSQSPRLGDENSHEGVEIFGTADCADLEAG